MADEGFHEIQLNGKQLIFLFMTAAVVLVVAFLCGVMVGRGVRSQKDGPQTAEVVAQTTPAASDAAAAAPAAQAAPPPPTTAAVPPQPADEDLSYSSRLQGQTPPAESLKAPGSQPAGESKAARDVKDARNTRDAKGGKPQRSETPAAEAAPPSAAAAPGEPQGPGYALQIAALRDRSEADAVVKRLGAKGYNAYVMAPTGKGAAVYRVRVGKFKTRREADSARRRLEKEEQFKPWITR